MVLKRQPLYNSCGLDANTLCSWSRCWCCNDQTAVVWLGWLGWYKSQPDERLHGATWFITIYKLPIARVNALVQYDFCGPEVLSGCLEKLFNVLHMGPHPILQSMLLAAARRELQLARETMLAGPYTSFRRRPDRNAEGVDGRGDMGKGCPCPLTIPPGGASWAPQRGPGWNPGRKWILYIYEVRMKPSGILKHFFSVVLSNG